MSGDDMVFGEIKYREPARVKRPDRDPRHACVACQTPGPNDLPIFLDRGPADLIERHALSDVSVELGGILLGKECVDPATGDHFAWITQALEAKHYANTQASFTYTHDSWEEITRDRDRLYPDLDIVGWYHTHPSFGIFLSHHDLFIHQNFFAQPLQVAYVVDPIQSTRGFFRWSDGKMVQVGGFHLCAERTERLALSKLANDLENLPSPSGQGGSALSPRLEAELIKMLSRPAHPHAGGPAERLSILALLAMLGSFLGVVGLAAALWLFQLNTRLGEQTEALVALQRHLDDVAGGQRLAVDTLLDKVGGEDPSKFIARYERTAKARDESHNRLLAELAINETLGLRAKELAADLDAARASLKESEADAKEAPALRKRLGELEKANTLQERELEEKRPIVEATDGEKAKELVDALKLYRTTTWAGALASLLLGLTAVYFYFKSLPEPQSTIQPSPTTHRIV
ncbi:MAG: Mov34/MPN/PAD-1 family protein [Paludisphaera borealis]|uniref:Mov34/MPN/PAD-1 family protein n=1 Tax=Paludisphaera borealis TaxID=1387353 RepID=UPI0028466F5E|nr:Mov34/MPN/PAD-1 family protein [Paludisphaera borealis]MDR3620046.1 Mov34/MPN/PAD-1 family protein [Paludisphaera borealis]